MLSSRISRLANKIHRNRNLTPISKCLTPTSNLVLKDYNYLDLYNQNSLTQSGIRGIHTTNVVNGSIKLDFVEIFDSAEDALKDVKSNSSLLVGGFGLCGVPESLIRAIANSTANNLTIISNEGGVHHHGLDMLLEKKKIKKIVCSFVGENKLFQMQYLTGEIEVELTPQGTLAEKIRCGGAGIPAFYTPAGVGTLVHHGGEPIKYTKDGNLVVVSKPKESRVFGDTTYLLEEAITAEFALIKGWRADKAGNIQFRKSAANFNLVMAKAAKTTIAEVEEIVEVGELDPNFIHLPGIYVDRLIKPPPYEKYIEKRVLHTEDKKRLDPIKERIVRRAALEFRNGIYANLGIGLPMLTADYIPKGMNVLLQAENGILGMGPYPSKEKDLDADVINPGKETVTIVPGGAFITSDESFAMIRGHHLDFTMLGGMQCSQYGDLANWMIPKKLVKGMGGAMDLVGKNRVIVLMTHTSKTGEPKIFKECTLPLTGSKVVDMIITDKCVFKVDTNKGLTLLEIAEGLSIDDIKKTTAAEFRVSKDLKIMGQI